MKNRCIASLIIYKSYNVFFSIIYPPGLDGCGKTSTAIALSKHMNAKYIRTPPDSIRNFRSYFDSSDDATKRAYYMVGNFIVAEDMIKTMEVGMHDFIFNLFNPIYNTSIS